MIPFADVPKRCHYRRMTRAKATLLAVAILLAASCQDKSLIASSTKLSPDGVMMAAVQTEGYGGLGTSAVITTVSLGIKNGGRPADVLSIEQNDSRSDHIGFDWTKDRTLRIAVRDAQIDFQAVKSGGVTIETVQTK